VTGSDETSVRASRLATVPFLSDLDEAARADVLPSLRERRVVRGGVVFRQGEESRAAFVVLEGQIRITVLSANGAEMTIDVLAPGDTFGIVGLAGDLPRISNAVATRASLLLEVPTETLRALMRRDPHVFREMMEQLLRRLGRSIQEHVSSGTQRVYARVAAKLLALSVESGAERRLPEGLSHQDLASMVGSTRATVTRVLQDLRKRGILDVDPSSRRLIIREADKLSEMTEVDSAFHDGRIVLP
jgi:CRP-like cAMP-binding protein